MATWWNNLGMVLHDLGDLDGASVQLERALEISEATLGPDHPNVAVTRANLAAAAGAPYAATLVILSHTMAARRVVGVLAPSRGASALYNFQIGDHGGQSPLHVTAGADTY